MAKKDKCDYMCMYVLGDGRTQQVSKSISAANIGEAMEHMSTFIAGMCKKNNEEFTSDTVVSFTIMRKPSRKGRRSPKA